MRQRPRDDDDAILHNPVGAMKATADLDTLYLHQARDADRSAKIWGHHATGN